MKEVLFSFTKVFSLLLALSLAVGAEAQIDRTPDYYSKTDTTTNTETITFELPNKYIRPFMDAVGTWQIHCTGLSDTTTYTITIEETLDKTSTVWVPTYTIVSGANTLAADTYLINKALTGYRQRVKVAASGTSTTMQVKVYATVRKKTWGTNDDGDDIGD